MDQDSALDILKSALLLERRGRAFYTTAAQQAGDNAVRLFFETLADEENRHIRVLSEQFAAISRGRSFSFPPAAEEEQTSAAQLVLNGEMQARITAADFEAAAISAAMAMEERAVRLYTRRATESRDNGEKALYRWLSQWESQHLEALAAIDRTLTEKIWNDNSFWPY